MSLQVSFFLSDWLEDKMRKRMAEGFTRAEVSKNALREHFKKEVASHE